MNVNSEKPIAMLMTDVSMEVFAALIIVTSKARITSPSRIVATMLSTVRCYDNVWNVQQFDEYYFSLLARNLAQETVLHGPEKSQFNYITSYISHFTHLRKSKEIGWDALGEMRYASCAGEMRDAI